MSEEELVGKLVTGVLADVEKPEYTELYDGLIEQLRSDSASLELPEREIIAAWAAEAGGESS